MTYTPPVIGSGLGTGVMLATEGTYGAFDSSDWTSKTSSYEIKSETMELKKTTVQGEGLHKGGLYARTKRRVPTNWTANGGLTMDLAAGGINHLLKHMFGSPNANNAGSPPADGALTGQDTDAYYEAYHGPATVNGLSFALQKFVDTASASSTAECLTYTGCKISDWTVSVQTGEIAQLALTIDGYNELGGGSSGKDPLNDAVPAAQTWTDPSPRLFNFQGATLYSGNTFSTADGWSTPTLGDPIGQIKSVSVKHALALDTSRYFVGGAGYKDEQLENGLRAITGSFVIEWDGFTMYNAFQADTELSLSLVFTTDFEIDDSGPVYERLEIDIPSLKLDGESPKVGGPEVITQSVSFTGLDNETDNPIQASYLTADATDYDA